MSSYRFMRCAGGAFIGFGLINLYYHKPCLLGLLFGIALTVVGFLEPTPKPEPEEGDC